MPPVYKSLHNCFYYPPGIWDYTLGIIITYYSMYYNKKIPNKPSAYTFKLFQGYHSFVVAFFFIKCFVLFYHPLRLIVFSSFHTKGAIIKCCWKTISERNTRFSQNPNVYFTQVTWHCTRMLPAGQLPFGISGRYRFYVEDFFKLQWPMLTLT
jgi:hypothetical protein